MKIEQGWADFWLDPGGKYYDAFGRLMYINTSSYPVHVVVNIFAETFIDSYKPKHMAQPEVMSPALPE